MTDIIQTRFEWRRGTAAQWATANPVLLDGEPGRETDTGKWKLGDGVTAWNDLPYQAGDEAALSATYARRSGYVTDVVKDHGAKVDGATDDTAAWQAAINDVAANGGGTIVSSRRGVSVIAGALQDSTGANAQLLLPSIDCMDGKQITVSILGPTAPPPVVSVVGNTPVPDQHLVLLSTLTAGNGAVIGGIGPAGTFANFTNVLLQMKNVTVRTQPNPTYSGLDLRHAAAIDIDNVVVDTGSYYVQGLAQPSTSTSFGLRTPGNDNGAYTRLGAVNVVGFYNGYEFGEHSTGQQVAAWGCVQPFTFVAANHASKFQRLMAVHCPHGITFTGTHYVDIDQYDVEHATAGWFTAVDDVNDPNNYGHGTVTWHVVKAAVGIDSTFVVTGAAGLRAMRIGSDGDTGRRDITSLLDATTASTYPNMKLFVHRMGKRVVYSFVDSAEGITGDVYLLRSIPAGFSNPEAIVGGAGLAVGALFDNNTGHILSASSAYFSTSSGLRLLGTSGTPVVGRLEFETTDPWPSSLPGVAA